MFSMDGVTLEFEDDAIEAIAETANKQKTGARGLRAIIENIMLEIRNLHASVEGKEILKGVNLTIGDGEVHVLMGPNGSGKSTLSNVLVGNPKYTVTEGSITFNGKDLLALSPEDRAHEGIFMSFQAPTEIPGVSMTNFMRAAINAKRTYFGQPAIPAGDFLKLLKEKRKLVGLDAHFMSRGVNEGFSGGERKRNEIFRFSKPAVCTA